eukprot:9408181-Pyramimonas_sp.AAC.1
MRRAQSYTVTDLGYVPNSRLSPEEQREQMKMRIRSDNEEIAAAEQQIKMIQDQIRKHESRYGASVKADLPESSGMDTQ